MFFVFLFVNVLFSYNGKKEDYLYEGLEFGVDCDSCIVLVGLNGVGKFIFLKFMIGEFLLSVGMVDRYLGLSIGKYY